MFCRKLPPYGDREMHSTGRRLKAARMLGGFTSPKALADQLAMRNMSESTLRTVEADKRGLEKHEREAIAHACRIDPAFFTVDLSDLTPTPQPAVVTQAQVLLREALAAAQALGQAPEADDASPEAPDRPGLAGEAERR